MKKENCFLTLKHYKEPLKPVEKGFGYYGAIQVTIDGQKIQCHECGALVSHLGAHAFSKHRMKAKEYRTKFQLSPSTSLISEAEKERLKERTFRFFASLSEEEKRVIREKVKKGREEFNARNKNYRKSETLEDKNRKGTCPDQILEKLRTAIKEIGHVPSLFEFEEHVGTARYRELVYKIFGSWSKAVKMAGYTPKSKGGAYSTTNKKYNREELLEYMSIFAQENRKLPMTADCKRGLLPPLGAYLRHFGSIEEARLQANVYDFVE